MVRTKSGGDSTVRPECVIRGVLFHPTRLKGSLLDAYSAPSFMKRARFPARHRADLGCLAGRLEQLRGARQVARGQRGVAMAIQGRCGAPLAVTQPRALLAGAAHKRALEPRAIPLHHLPAVQGQLRGGQHKRARRGGGVPVDHDHEPQRAFARDVPDESGRQMPMGRCRPGAERGHAAEGLHMAVASRLPPRPTALWVRAGGEQPTVGVAPQRGHRVQGETDRFIQGWLLRPGPVHARRR
jgi:hypothetical protein